MSYGVMPPAAQVNHFASILRGAIGPSDAGTAFTTICTLAERNGLLISADTNRAVIFRTPEIFQPKIHRHQPSTPNDSDQESMINALESDCADLLFQNTYDLILAICLDHSLAINAYSDLLIVTASHPKHQVQIDRFPSVQQAA